MKSEMVEIPFGSIYVAVDATRLSKPKEIVRLNAGRQKPDDTRQIALPGQKELLHYCNPYRLNR